MPVCPECGHAAGDVRFCPRCGHRLEAAAPDDGTHTAERPAVPHTSPSDAPPPPLPPAPTSARYPLFADEATDAAPGSTTADLPVTPAAAPQPAPSPGPGHADSRRARPAWLPLTLVAAVALLVVAGAGAWLLGRDDDPARGGAAGGGGGAAGGDAVDVSREATAVAPVTAPPNQDVDGNLVRYDARQMLDGVPETTWRMPGDGTGEVLVFRLDEAVRLSEVGLVNGYAKTAQDGASTFDWYTGNRRVLAVEWTFDDGSTVTQELEESRELQKVEAGGVTTSTVELRLVSVSPPGAGPSSRDYTAISEVSLVGVPG
jgi:hypothetical protein